MSAASVEQVAQASVKFDDLVETPDGVAWVESRPGLDGRSVVVRWDATTGRTTDLALPGGSVGSAVHAYGGGVHAHDAAGCYAVRSGDSQVVRLGAAGPREVTSARGAAHGDLRLVGSELLCVREIVGSAEGDSIVTMSPAGERVLVQGDFLAAPTRDRDGRLAWLRWTDDHMPWDATELWVSGTGDTGDTGDTGEAGAQLVAGGDDESVLQPSFDGQGNLYYISDRTGWWNLYRWDGASSEALAPMAAECAAAPWELGYRSYVVLEDGRIALLRSAGPTVRLVLRHHDGTVEELPLPFTSYKPCLATVGGRIAAIAADTAHAPRVVLIDPDRPEAVTTLAGAPAPAIVVSVPERLSVSYDGHQIAVLWFPPTSAHASGGEPPPLIVRPHPGPTDNMRERLTWWTQYFTGQGFAVAEFDYRGSTGYGRPFRQQLYGHWGTYDTDDAIAVARHLVASGKARADRVFISGESAGGFTALKAISRPGTPFAAAVASMAITDPARWRDSVPRFQRSHAAQLAVGAPRVDPDLIERPVLLIHGADDEVATASAVQDLARRLDDRGIPHRLLVFDGEGHGYSAPVNVAAALTAERELYEQVLAGRPENVAGYPA